MKRSKKENINDIGFETILPPPRPRKVQFLLFEKILRDAEKYDGELESARNSMFDVLIDQITRYIKNEKPDNKKPTEEVKLKCIFCGNTCLHDCPLCSDECFQKYYQIK